MAYRRRHQPSSRSVVVRCAISISLVLVLLWVILVGPISRLNSTKPKLFFDATSKRFKILQLADLHLGEDPFTDWGPAADEKSVRVIHDLIGIEEPDLIVMSGDQLTANNVDANATIYYNLLADAMQDVPYAMIFGNHDDADFEKGYYPNGTIIRHHAKTSRMQLRSTPS